MRILRAADHAVMPWKNGAGATTQIAVAPTGAGLDSFDWRVSMAAVIEDGPFSTFPGVDRTLAVLEGEGIVLDVAGRAPCELTRESPPAAFPGDAPTHGRLINGPITDLNVMSRRGRLSHRLTRCVIDQPAMIAPEQGIMMLLTLAPGLVVDGERLGTLDAVLFDTPVAVEGDAPAGAGVVCFLVELWETAGDLDK
ncbi:HutD/Ves family protein [Ancylobacter pratisalsi]|uniref:HutD family protein n=1 Tax=Ancylobacter pratisalsi TaxID=1745854 RepID=A0A6P1YPW1_9HYPH|nr:HutD family protein [Ancylobacter pratisalsi]QIB35478.1 HutD family protein [Ancylobacter pratisalsi]